MVRDEARLAPSSRAPRLPLLAVFTALLLGVLGLLAQSASADHTTLGPPAVTSAPPSPSTSTSPTWTFTVTGASASCSMTGPASAVRGPVDCTSGSYTPSPPLDVDGSWTFAVTQTSPSTLSDSPTVTIEAGGTSHAGEHPYVLDTTAPVVTVAPLPGEPGWSVGVADTTATTVVCTVDGPGSGGPVSIGCADGTARPDLSEGDGPYLLAVTATDAVGLIGTGGGSYTHDGTAPVVTLTRDTASPGVERQPTWTIAVDDGSTPQCVLRDQSGSSVPGGSCTASGYTAPTLTADGTYTLTVTAVDGAGNAATPKSSSYVLDAGQPSVTITGPSTGRTATVTWTVEVTGATTVECTVDGQARSCTAGGTVTSTLSQDGTTTLVVTARDGAGADVVRSATYVYDSTAPGAPSIDSAPVSPGRVATVTWTFTGPADAALSCAVVATGATPTGFTACSGSYTATLADGDWTFVVRATDAAGNSTDASARYVLDTVAPAAPSIDSGPVSPGRVATVTWTFTGPADATLTCAVVPTGSTATVFTACSGSFTATLADGDWTFVVRATDAAGNTTDASARYVLDTNAPGTPGVTTSPPSRVQSGTTVTWEVTGDPTGVVRTECRLRKDGDDPAWADCGGRTITRTLTGEGSYVLEVREVDAAGNTSPVAAATAVVVDDTPPAAPSVTGTSGEGRTPGMTWTLTPAAVDGGTSLECRLVRDGTAPGAFTACGTSVTLTAPSDGTYRLEVRSVDAAGNRGAGVLSDPYRYDSTPPAAATVTVAPAGNVRTVTWTVVLPEDRSTTQCRLSRTAGGTTTTVSDWQACAAPYTSTLSAGDGSYLLEVRVVDAVGNVGPVSSAAHVLDTTPPSAPVVTSDRTVRDDQRTVTYTITGEGSYTCQLLHDGAPVGGPVACTGTWVVELPRVSGEYVLQVVATDAVGNTGPSADSPAYDLDVTPPATPTVTGSRSGTDNEREVTYTFSGEGTATCQLALDGTAVGTAVPCSSPWTVTLPAQDGTWTLLVVYTDDVGNVGAAGSSGPYVLDLTPPAVPVVAGPSGTGNTPTATWSWTGEGTATCQLLRDGAPVGSPVPCSSPWTVALPGDGSWSLQVVLTDAVGNVAAPATSATYLLDTAAPAAPAASGPTGPAQSRAPTWTFTAEAGTTASCRLLRGATVVADWAPCSPGGTAGDLTGQPDGSYVLEVRLTDAAGNTTSRSSAPYVLDTTAPVAPVVTGPPGPSQLRTPRFTWTSETGTNAECQLARDGTAGEWTACASGYAPALPADGTWTLTVRLTDAAGNVSAVATSGGYVFDTTAPGTPVVSPPRPTGRDTAPVWAVGAEAGSSLECRLTGPTGVLADWAVCGAAPSPSLAGRPDGRYVLEVRATDAAGNTSAVGSGAYVLDTVAPAAAVVTAPASPGRTRAPVFTFTVEPGATATCRLTSGSTVVSEPAACTSPAALDLTGLPDGTYTLTVRVVDAAGNPGPAASGTYVLDTTAPAAPVLHLSPATPGPDASPTWAFSAEAGATFTCRVVFPTGAVRELPGCTSPLTVDLSGLPDGAYVLTVRAVDAAGNVGAAVTSTYELSAAAPAAPTVTGPVTPGTTRTPTWTVTGSGTECRLTRGTTVLTDWAPCSGGYTADLFSQPDGVYVLSARTRTATGTSAAVTSRYILDTLAPAAPVLVAPLSPSTDRAPTWTIASPGLSGRAECSVLLFGTVLSPWQPCATSTAGSPFPYGLTGLGDGTYVLVVRVYDSAGNRSPEASAPYVLDTSAPTAVGVTAPPSPGNDDTPTWQLASGAGASLECRLLGPGDVVVADWAPCAGTYTALLTGLPDGAYTLSIRALSAAGTPGPETTSQYELRTTAPTAPTALVGPTSPGRDTSPTWSWTLPPGATGWCKVTSGDRVLLDAACGTTLTVDLSSAGDGTYVLTVWAVWAAGESTRSAALTGRYVLDTEPTRPPTFTVVPGATGSTLTPTWSFTVVRGARAECRLLHAGRVLDDWAPCDGSYTAALAGRPDGPYALQVRAVDSAGNPSQVESREYVLDRTGVALPVFTGLPATPSSVRTATWTFTAPDGALECRLTRPGAAPGPWEPCTGGVYRLSLPLSAPDGEHVLEVRVVDATGRTGAASRASYVLDTTPPPAPPVEPGQGPAGRDAQVSWSWPAGDELVECRLLRGGTPLTGWAPCEGDVDLTRYGQGDYALEVRLVDDAGNAGPSTTSGYRYDTTPPPAPSFTSRPPSSGTDRTVTWTFAVPADVTRVTCALSSGGVVRETACGSRLDADLTGLAPGTWVLTVRFVDAAGNASTASTSYLLLSGAAAGPVRVDPPAPGPVDGPAVPPRAPVPGPGRGGTGAPPAAPDSPTAPPLPTDADVLSGSPSRPTTPTAPPADEPAQEGPVDGPRVPDVQSPLAVADVPDAIAGVVGGTLERPALPLALLAVVVLFLLAQNRIDRRDPKLAAAPVEAEPELDFRPFRPGEAT